MGLAVATGGPEVVGQAGMQEPGPNRVAPGVDVAERRLGELGGQLRADRRSGVPWTLGAAGRLPGSFQQRGPVAPDAPCRVVHLGPQAEGRSPGGEGLRERQGPLGHVSRPDQRHERLACIAGRHPVVGPLGRRPLGGQGGHGGSETAVERSSLPGEEVVVERFADQGMAKAVGVGVGHHDVAVDRLAQPAQQLALGQLRRRGQQGMGERPGGHRQEAGAVDRGVGEALDPGHQQVAQRGPQPAAVLVPGDQLLDEERVALGPGADAPDELVRLGTGGAPPGPRLGPGVVLPSELALMVTVDDGGHELGHLRIAEAQEVHAAHGGASLQRRHQLAGGAARVHLVDADRRHDHEALVTHVAGQELERGGRRGVGPVQVLEDQHDRGRRG